MEEKKSFFELLDAKSALIVGVVAGFLIICTIGFFIMLFMALNGKLNLFVAAKDEPVIANQQPTANNNQPAPANIPKSNKPIVEVFVMSYCPFGLQMEKAVLPAWELLKNKADISIKFVSYAMHGLKEVEENTRQYCIATEQADKYIAYLKCFTGKDDFASCLKEAKVSESKMNACVSATDKKFGTIVKYNDQSTWLSGRYPVYPVHADLNTKYGVQGSPTLIINGVEASVGRTPEAVKQAICAAFNSAPSECGTTLSAASPVAGFGTGTGAATGGAECGS